MRFMLPESLGSREAEAIGPVTGATVEVVLVDTPEIRVTLPAQWLTEVKPTLPEEPPYGTVVRALITDEDEPWVFERLSNRTDGKNWGAAGRDEAYAWADLNVRAAPVVLVLDPFAEPVELPWERWLDGSRVVRVNCFGHPPFAPVLSLEAGGRKIVAELSQAEARAIAAALMAANDAADKAGQP